MRPRRVSDEDQIVIDVQATSVGGACCARMAARVPSTSKQAYWLSCINRRASLMACCSVRSPAATSARRARCNPRRAWIEYAIAAVGQKVSPPKPNSLLLGTACRKRRTKSAELYGANDHAQERSTQTFG